MPDELVNLLRDHKLAQNKEREAAGQLWVDKGYVFTSPTGEPLNPNTDHHEWKKLLQSANVRDARLHDARHTAGTVLLTLGVPDRIVDALMGWEPGTGASRMRRRYQHVTDPILKDIAKRVDGLLWGNPKGETGQQGSGSKDPTETTNETSSSGGPIS